MEDADRPISIWHLREVCPACPDVSPSTLRRWCVRGIRTPAGNRIKLKGFRAGSWWVRPSQLLAFLKLLEISQPSPPRHDDESAIDAEADVILAGAGMFNRRVSL